MSDLATLLDTLEAAQVTGIAALREMIGRLASPSPAQWPEDVMERMAKAIAVAAAEHRMKPFIDGWERDYVRIAALRFANAALASIPPVKGLVATSDRMPDRIWAWDSHEGCQYSFTESAWGRHQYVRATPELLALVEEAIKFEKAVHTNSWTVEYVQRAALAYARAQVQR